MGLKGVVVCASVKGVGRNLGRKMRLEKRVEVSERGCCIRGRRDLE
jgi:hypothetical protein